jgi:hypothetical protein
MRIVCSGLFICAIPDRFWFQNEGALLMAFSFGFYNDIHTPTLLTNGATS